MTGQRADSRSFEYRGRQLSEISFPLGGIGSGCIGLAGNGALVDWEIFNRPSKGSRNGFSHFAIRAESDDRLLDARILQGPLPAPYTGQLSGRSDLRSGYGLGPSRGSLAGAPHFHDVVFRGRYPVAELDFACPHFPGEVRLLAFNPFIPLNDRDSSIPAAFFEFEVRNNRDHPVRYALLGVLSNPLEGPNLNRAWSEGGIGALRLASSSRDGGKPGIGDLTLATDADEVSWQEYWHKGPWYDDLEAYFRDLRTPGPLRNRDYRTAQPGSSTTGMLAAHFDLEPGDSRTIRYVVSWSFPNVERTWGSAVSRVIDPLVNTLARLRGRSRVWKNYYASLWADSTASARYALESWPRLRDETLCFRDALFASSLPDEALDAVSANLSILKSPTVLRLPDGTLYGFEGTLERDGCCEGSCNHVWNYVQSTAFLFPSLERSMRSANYRYTQDADGALQYRLILPLGSTRLPYRPCADGQFGEVMQAYRDWRICGDDSWLRELWPHIKRSIAYAWSDENADRWDPERTGVLWGRQHHTLDMDLFGPNAWLTGFYLGALKAAAEMAQHFGEPETAGEYRGLFDKGKSWIEGHLFNGEYYQQQVDLDHPSTLEGLGRTTLMDRFTPPAFRNTYWSEEHGEVARQIGAGCAIDQVLAQSHATLYGLGEIFDPEQVRSALRSIYTYNFKSEMREHWNPDRIFALGNEGGLVICEWPAHVRRPGLPINYASETFNGCEYAAATHMIQMGLVEEGMACVRAVRHRYDGERRNPWNEIECGGNYARSMASYALLNAFSGLQFDMRRRVIGFAPVRRDGESFRCFWSLDPAWGEVEIDDEAIELRVLAGSLPLAGLVVPLAERPDLVARLGGLDLAFRRDGETVWFEEPIEIAAGCALRLARRGAPLVR